MFNLIQTAIADEPGSIVNCGPGHLDSSGHTIVCGKEAFFGLVHNVMNWGIYLAGLAVVVAVVYGGFLYLISQGEAEKLNKAKKAIFGAITGLVITLTAWIIVNLIVSTIFGCSGWNVFGSITCGATSL